MISDPNTLLHERRSSLALRSGAAALFAIACFWPTVTDAMLIKLFAAYAFVDGVLTLSSGRLGSLLPLRMAAVGRRVSRSRCSRHGIRLVWDDAGQSR
jgi:hypothetical protein